jgi:hypothetical protein
VNYLVYLDTRAGELERVLSGVKTMLIKEFGPAGTTAYPVRPGDGLYFVRDNGESAVRVKATVTRALFLTNRLGQDLSHTLKEMQPRLQLTEEQYNYWSARDQVLLVEFESAHKIGAVEVAPRKIADRSDWVAFEELSLIT